MPWVRLDDALGDDPRIAMTGAIGAGVLALALCYSNRNLTDGWLPAIVLRRYLLGDGSRPEAADEATGVLLQSCLLASADRDGIAGFQVHAEYVCLQPTRAQILKARGLRHQQKADAGRLGGIESGKARRKQKRSRNEARVEQTDSIDEAPIPIPIPIPIEEQAVAAPPPHAEENPDDNINVITKIAHETIALLGSQAELGDITEAVKSQCSQLRIKHWPGEVVRKAVDSALWQRAHRHSERSAAR